MLRIANCSGFWGDRFSAAREMVDGGAIDVLTGDYLAELTMAILARQRARERPAYVAVFVKQMEQVLADCLAREIKVVANAGGLDPRGCAAALERLAARLGVRARVAVVDGDDLLPRIGELRAAGERFCHLDSGASLPADAPVVTANAYLGGWGIADALARGADVVVTGRVSDAALVVGPAAWRFGWARDDWDRLAGAVAAGHIIECSAQATGGNYSFLDEVDWSRPLGFPIAEMHEDGSFVITKHPGTGGRVNVGTVTAQLLYEIEGARYFNPDVVARFDTVTLTDEGHDRVRGSGTRGEPPPSTLKVAVNLDGGYRNEMGVRVVGLDVAEKVRLLAGQLADASTQTSFELRGLGPVDPRDNVDAVRELVVTVRSRDPAAVGKAWSARVVELALSSVPGFGITHPPGDATPFFVYWPTLVGATRVTATVTLDGESRPVAAPPTTEARAALVGSLPARRPPEKTVRAPLGRVFGSRSGDKGGNANLGLWAKTHESYAWLVHELTVDRLCALFPDLAACAIERALLPNLHAVNFVLRGLLGDGVAASTRFDPQAKTLGEYVRARVVELPETLLSCAAFQEPPRRP